MAAEAVAKRNTVRDWLAVTVERFNKAGLYFGHGSNNPHDEAAYLLLQLGVIDHGLCCSDKSWGSSQEHQGQ